MQFIVYWQLFVFYMLSVLGFWVACGLYYFFLLVCTTCKPFFVCGMCNPYFAFSFAILYSFQELVWNSHPWKQMTILYYNSKMEVNLSLLAITYFKALLTCSFLNNYLARADLTWTSLCLTHFWLTMLSW